MKKKYVILLILIFLLSGCSKEQPKSVNAQKEIEEKNKKDSVKETLTTRQMVEDKAVKFIKGAFALKSYNELHSKKFEDFLGNDEDFVEGMVNELDYYESIGVNFKKSEIIKVKNITKDSPFFGEAYYAVNLEVEFDKNTELPKRKISLYVLKSFNKIELYNYDFSHFYDTREFLNGLVDVSLAPNDDNEEKIMNFSIETVKQFLTFNEQQFINRENWIGKNWMEEEVEVSKEVYEKLYDDYKDSGIVLTDIQVNSYYPITLSNSESEYIVNVTPLFNKEGAGLEEIGLLMRKNNGELKAKSIFPYSIYPWDYE